jgi:hypothetical protein
MALCLIEAQGATSQVFIEGSVFIISCNDYI